MHPFLGLLIGAASPDKLGYIPYAGENSWSACNSVDAGLLYVEALEKAEAGTAVHAVQEFIRIKNIAEALGKKTGHKVAEADKEALGGGKLGWLSFLLGMNQDVGTSWTRETFGWEPSGQKLLEEVEQAEKAYFDIENSAYVGGGK